MACFIGVDGGGSGCRVSVTDEGGACLGRGASGPANVFSDPSGALANLRDALRSALQDAGRTEAEIVWAHFGLAGVLEARQAQEIAAEMAFPASVSDDRKTFVVGALGDRDGALAALGTGSFVAAKRGAEVRGVGGWGAVLSDHGSGAWLGRAALEQTLLAHDRMAEETDFTRTMLSRFDGPVGIVRFAASAAPAEIAELAPQLVSAAQAGDAAALDLLSRGADYIAGGLRALAVEKSAPLCLSGGLGPSYAGLLAARGWEQIIAPEGTALDGAVRLALLRGGARGMPC
jgi:glucosamine kinase